MGYHPSHWFLLLFVVVCATAFLMLASALFVCLFFLVSYRECSLFPRLMVLFLFFGLLLWWFYVRFDAFKEKNRL